jgi:hypothetical protein
MKIAQLFLLACCFTFAVAGCGGSNETSVITDDLSQDDFAKYEADLAKASEGADYDDALEGEDE